MTKVLGVIATMDPLAGGPPSAARNIWVAAARAGLCVSAAFGRNAPVSAGEAGMIADLAGQGIAAHAFPLSGSGRGLAGRWGISLGLAGWLCRNAGAFDVVELHGSWTFSTLAAAFAARLHGKILVLFPHESLSRFDRAKGGFPLKAFCKGLLRRALFAALDEVVFSSPLERRDSFSPAETARGAVLFHPVLDEREAARGAAPAAGGALRVGFLGRLDSKKNLEILIDCLARDPALRLEVAGDGAPAYRAGLEARAAALGVEDRIRWRGFIGAAERTGFFAGIDLLAMPSAYECFGMVAAEAMCCGLPVVVSRQSGIAELVARHEAGRVVAPELGEIVAVLGDLAADRARLRTYAEGARRLAEKDLSFAFYGDRLAGLYRSLSGAARENHA